MATLLYRLGSTAYRKWWAFLAAWLATRRRNIQPGAAP